MGVSDSARKIIVEKIEVIKDQIARISTIIDDYDQRIQTLQTSKHQEVQKKKDLEKLLADLKGDVSTIGQSNGV